MMGDLDFEPMMAKPWTPATAEVEVPAALVSRGAPAHFSVRMATAEEMSRANDARMIAEKARAMLEALAGMGGQRQAEVYKEAVGLSSSTVSDEFIKQIEFVTMCTVSPPLNRERALWLSRFQPLFFKLLFLKIMELSQEGATPGEAQPSTEIPASD